MKYVFPNIKHIDEVLPAIEGSPEFIVAEKDGYTVVNYVVSTEDTFPDVKDEATRIKAIRRECRGLIFGADGRVIARRYHKFFNAGERLETQIKSIDVSKPHIVLEKLDGSMITPIPVEGGIRWGTKMGVTDVSLPVEEYVMDHSNYIRFAKECIERDYTPIFEWCSPKQRIVIDHKEDQLILTAIRCNHTGVYYAYEPMTKWAQIYDIPVVKVFDSSVDNLQKFIDELSKREDVEGVVIRFNDGHMVKIKTEWYVRIHKAKDLIAREHDVCKQILANEIDDAKAFLPLEDQRRIVQYEHDLLAAIHAKVSQLTEYVTELHKLEISRKDYALKHAINNHSVVNAIVYKAWDDSSLIFGLVIDVVMRNCNKMKNFEEIKGIMLPGVFYN
jgi:RNA ligase